MRFNKLDLNQLVVLDALLAERSVSKTAERLFLSQPATSCALGRLRGYFEDDLLVQVGKTMVLTPLAQSMAQPLRDVVLRLQAFTTVHADFDPKTAARKLKVEASDYVIEVFLTEAMRHCWAEAPHIEIDIRRLGARSVERLEQGEADLLICPEFRAGRSQPSEPLFRDTMSCIVWEGNTDVGTELTQAEFFSLGHVAAVWGDGQLPAKDQMFPTKDKRKCEVIVPGFTLIPQFVVGTRRVAALQTRLAMQAAQSLPLRVLPCPIETPLVQEVVQWHRFREEDPLLRWFRSLFQRVATQM
jgi:LysR family nod box-dependent transcriptional activator